MTTTSKNTTTRKPRHTTKPHITSAPTTHEPDAEVQALLSGAIADLAALDQWHDAHAAQNFAGGVLAGTVSKLADRLLARGGITPAERDLIGQVVSEHYHVVARVIG